MSRTDRIRIAILLLMVAATALLAFRVHRTKGRTEELRTEIIAALAQRARQLDGIEAQLLRSQILQTHLDECFEFSDSTLNSVERDPCRFVCSMFVPVPMSASMAVDLRDLQLWESELDEAICGDLR